MRIDKREEKSLQNLTTSKAMEIALAETVSTKQSHPYYGLRDKNGWMTRYPIEGLVWTREEVREYIKGGGSFDSMVNWGCSPYGYPEEFWYGMTPFILGKLVSGYGRYDFLPVYKGQFPIHNTIEIQDYLRLMRGAEMRNFLNFWGIENSASLFTLSKKTKSWAWRKVQQNVSFNKVIQQLRSKESFSYSDDGWCGYEHYQIFEPSQIETIGEQLEMFTDEAFDNSAFAYARKCYKKMQVRQEPWVRNKDKTMTSLAGHRRAELSNNRRICGQEMLTNFQYSYSSVGRLKCFKNSVFLEGKEYPSRKVGDLNVVKIQQTFFVWRKDFSKHIESSISLKDSIAKFVELRKDSIEKEILLEKGELTLREFYKMTHSCIFGTQKFLEANMPHIYRQIEYFQSWGSLLQDDVAEIKWSLTPEAIESIKFRF